MKKRTGQVTLGIGDGGNDVIMIQNSDVGIGIIGKEGQQAARAADYVLSEFKYLKRLCCVHGVDSVSRSWTISNYSFYKSIIFCVLQTSYAMFSSYSGVSLFNSMQVTLYNIFLFIPIVSMVTKRGYEEWDLLNRPSVYRYYNDTDPQNKQTLFSFREFIQWIAMGIVQALIVNLVGALIEHFPASTQHHVAECLGRAALPCSDVAGVLCVLVGEGTLGIRAVHVDAVGTARSDEGF